MNITGNGLIIADLHIRKDERFSPEEGYRLRTQPMQLLKRMKKLKDENNVGFIALLGDMIDTPACLPQETHVLNEFFSEMNSWGIPVFFILGQHDVDMNKYDNGKDSYFQRSNVTLIAGHYENFIYADHKTVILNDKYKIWFSNFSNPIEYPPEPVDIWLSHIDIGFRKIEEKNFKICIAGDIHDCYSVGNCHTVCTPYQHKAHEQPVGFIGFLDGDTMEFKRFPSDDENFQFLRFDNIKKLKKEENKEGNKNKIEVLDINFHEIIADEIIKRDLMDIHKKVDSSNAPNPVNLNFELKSIHLENYRSVKDFTLDFDDFKKILFLFGSYGAGKTTILSAIKEVLIGDTKSIGENVRFGETFCKLTLELIYEGRKYTISRGKKNNKGFFEFLIDDIEQTGNNAAAIEKYMKNCLPFVDFIEILIPQSGGRLFTREVGQKLLERCINLDVFHYYKDEATKLSKLYNEETALLRDKRNIEEAKFNEIFRQKEELRDSVRGIVVNNDLSELTRIKFVLLDLQNELSNAQGNLTAIDRVMGSYNFSGNIDIDKIKIELEELKTIYNDYLECKSIVEKKNLIHSNLMQVHKTYENLKNLLRKEGELPDESYENLKKNRDSVNQINIEIMKRNQIKIDTKRRLEDEIENLKNGILKGIYNCPTCGQRVVKDTSLMEKELKEKTAELSELGEVEPLQSYEGIDEKLKIWEDHFYNQDLIKQIEEIKIQGENLKKEYLSIQVKDISNFDIVDISGKIDNYTILINNYDKYNESLELRKQALYRLSEIKNKINNIVPVNREIHDFLNQIEKEISQAQYLKEVNKLVSKKEEEIIAQQSVIDDIESKIEARKEVENKWKEYIALMDGNDIGSLPYSMFEKLAKEFSNERFNIATCKELKNKKIIYDMNLELKDKTSEYWVSYKNASGGQMLLMEIFLFDVVSSYLGGIGFLALDENLNVASDDLYNELNETISALNFNKIVLISHNQRLSCYDKALNAVIDENRITRYI